ncbi:MAG TPA: TIGR01777 family oxidoreductase [Rubrobacteraceae bacterium]|nr:TIGR01777 family oxidoreductase [Rubrobacteraceae bacterium]
MRVLVSGATGLIGSALSSELENKGHRVIVLSRSEPSSEKTIRWDPSRGQLDASRLEGIDAVVHLAGESIIGRWTGEKKRRIRESRVQGTLLLAESIAGLSEKPRAMVCASGINYYGDRGNELLREESEPGDAFLSEVVKEWEAAADPAREVSIRVANLRFGVVLSPEGVALGMTLPIFKLGGGGKVGSGRQWWSWVALDDVVGALIHALENDFVEGPVNVVAPNPLTNAEYTKVLGEVLNRPTLVPVPAPAIRAVLGQVADELLLASMRVEPAKLKETGYEFRYPGLEGALRHLLDR